EDAVIAQAALSGNGLAECLDYYNDFHRALLPDAPWLFVVSFEELIANVKSVTETFNLHFGTGFTAPARSPAARFAAQENPDVRRKKRSGEIRLQKPVNPKSGLRQQLRRQLAETPALQRKLVRARELYTVFAPVTPGVPVQPLDLTTRNLPALA